MRSDERPPSPAGRIRVDAHERLELDSGWEAASCAPDAVSSPEEAETLKWIGASVPGTAAGALRALGDWDYGTERDLDAEDWWFRTTFEAAPAAAGEEVVLRLGGVATVHEVFLDGELIHAGDSMFAAAEVEVGAALREGGNELAIRCRALGPLLGGRRKPRARWRTKLVDGRLRFFRTMLLGRAPGFAPGPAAVGPWRPVVLERRRLVAIDRLELRPRLEGEDGVLGVAATVRGLGGFAVSGAEVSIGEAPAAQALEVTPGDDGAVELRGEVRVPGVEPWWPHTHGEPALHAVRLRLAGAGASVEVEAGPVGFRRLAAGPGADHDVLADGIDLHMNGVRVFARGAVWTPADFVGMAPDRARLREALEQVRAAGMNMVRIPGTAAYESTEFHDLCDQLGILVWQDFMFANLDYPLADEDFRASVEAEAAEQLAVIAGRPSLAVVCGNSEVEQQVAMLGLDPALGRGELFGELLPGALARSGADAIYVPSSPSGGARPFLPDRGIANYYGVGGYRRPLSDARLAEVKFAGECLAFANVPDEAGVEAVLPTAPGEVVLHHPRWKAGVPRDAGAGWDFDDVRDHYLAELFGVDAGELRRYDHERYLELSRAVSGEAMAAVFGEWRRAGSPSGGGLVLWLRDLLPGAGWGLVDSRGVPKWALLRLRAALAPTAVWMTDEGLAGIAVHLANDGPAPLRARLRASLYGDMSQDVGEAVEEVELPAHGALSRDLEELLGRFVDSSWAYRFGPPAQDAIVAVLEAPGGGGAPRGEAVHFPAGRPSAAESAERLGLEGEARAGEDGRSVLLTLRSRRLVWGLRVACPGSAGEEPLLVVEPGRERSLRLPLEPGVEPRGQVSVRALNLRGRMAVAIL
ncbi:MAG: glycoside hydrolase family 2 protein [Actinobacteria bacterium]|nr:glycoside hydrolase family 2 protein [Actinomycetota bacterium]